MIYSDSLPFKLKQTQKKLEIVAGIRLPPALASPIPFHVYPNQLTHIAYPSSPWSECLSHSGWFPSNEMTTEFSRLLCRSNFQTVSLQHLFIFLKKLLIISKSFSLCRPDPLMFILRIKNYRDEIFFNIKL